MHYSGVWDSRAIELHPDWAVRNADGSVNHNATSVFGPYVDRSNQSAGPAGPRSKLKRVHRPVAGRENRSYEVDVSVARQQGKLQVHLVNTSGPHATQPFLDTIAPVGPLQVTLRSGARPTRIKLEPGARSLEFHQTDGETHLTVAEVPIHSVIVVE